MIATVFEWGIWDEERGSLWLSLWHRHGRPEPSLRQQQILMLWGRLCVNPLLWVNCLQFIPCSGEN